MPVSKNSARKQPMPRANWDRTEAVLRAARRVLLYGPPGTGKTTASLLVDRDNTVKITVHEETPAAELIGHYLIGEEGKFVWRDGLAIKAWREGKRLLIDEVDKAASDTLTALYAICDDPMVAQLELPTGETITPHPDFRVVCTMNGEPEDLPAALRDRLQPAIYVGEPHPEAILALPKDLQEAARRGALIKDAERKMSIRAIKEFAVLRDELGEDLAAWAAFGKRYADVLNTLRIAADGAK